MGKIIETKINRWDGGMVNDPRDPDMNTARVVTGFNISSNPKKMTPHRSMESGDSAAATSMKKNFCIANWLPGSTNDYRLFSLGVVSGTSKAEIMVKTITTGGDHDLDDDLWSGIANNASGVNGANMELFVSYKTTNALYGARSGAYIWKYDLSAATWSDTHQALTYTSIAQGLVHSKDDILYIPYDNKIARNNAGSWNTTALTGLPSSHYITSICEKGNYLAIAMAPIGGFGNSKVYLWDRDSSLVELSETIDWGEGNLNIIEEIDGVLIGISSVGSSAHFKSKIVFKYASSTGAVQFKEIESSGGGTIPFPLVKQKVGNRLYFMMSVSIDSVLREGLWSIGRATPNSPFALVHENTPLNNTATETGNVYGFIIVGDYRFLSVYYNGNVYLAKTKNDGTAASKYVASSIYESKKFGTEDISLKKALLGVTISTEPLPTDGQVILKYRIDQETSWTTIFTEATDNSMSHSAVNIEATGATLPKDYKEIQFRIESTGNAEITSLSFMEEIIGKRIYG